MRLYKEAALILLLLNPWLNPGFVLPLDHLSLQKVLASNDRFLLKSKGFQHGCRVNLCIIYTYGASDLSAPYNLLSSAASPSKTDVQLEIIILTFQRFINVVLIVMYSPSVIEIYGSPL